MSLMAPKKDPPDLGLMPLATKAHPPLRPFNVDPGDPNLWIWRRMVYVPNVLHVLQPPTEAAPPFPLMPNAQKAPPPLRNPEQHQSETTDEEHDTNEEPMPKKQRKN